MDAPELKPCPFCGGDDVIRIDSDNTADDWVAIRCEKCLSQGPSQYDDPAAIRAWNRRAAAPDVAQAARKALLKRLDEEIIADAFRDRRIVDGALADRLIRERADAAAALRALAGETP